MRTDLEQARLYDNIWTSGKFALARKILAGNYVVVEGANVVHMLDPDGATRNVLLPAVREGLTYFIFNVGGTGDLSVRDSLSVELAVIEPAKGAVFVSSESEWGILAGGGGATGPLVEDLAALTDPDADRVLWWDDSAGALVLTSLSALTTEAAPAAGDFLIMVDAAGVLVKVDWSSLPGAGGGIANVVEDATPQLGGDLDGLGNDLLNMGVLFLTEQADAEADVAGKGQLWVDLATPNVLMFTDDAGTDFRISFTEAALKSTFNLEIGTDVQAFDAELSALAGLTSAADKLPYFTGAGTADVADFTAYGRSIVAVASEAAFKTLVNLEIGVDVQAFDADLTTWAGLTPSADAQSLVTAANFAAMRTLLDLEAGTDFYSIAGADAAFQPLDGDLTAIAALTTTAAGRSTLTVADDGLDELLVWDDSAGTMKTMPLADFTDEATPAAGDYLIIVGAEGDVRKANWSTLPGAGGGISNVVEDLTPQLGGDLDANAFNIGFDDNTGITDESGNEQLWFQTTASAVNFWQITNSAAGGVQRLEAAGSDADIAITIASKGTDPINFEVNGNIEVALTASDFSPGTDDGSALGIVGSKQWSDLFLATGGVVTFGNDISLTHSADLLTLSGGALTIAANAKLTCGPIELGHASDTTLDRVSAGVASVEGVPIVTSSDAANLKIVNITFIIDGGGSAITTGVKGYLEVPFACTINRATALADQSGSIVVDIWKDTYANYPPTDADSITASAPVTISTATKSQDATLTGWTTSVSAGDILGFNVDSITTCTRVTISLRVTKA